MEISFSYYHDTYFVFFRWNNHPVNLVSVFTGLYQSETLVDVTLAAEGKHLQAHKMLLSACSDYFQSLFSVNPSQHPIVILKDVRFEDLQTVVQFMYNGIVNVSSEKLPDVLKVVKFIITVLKNHSKSLILQLTHLRRLVRGLRRNSSLRSQFLN